MKVISENSEITVTVTRRDSGGNLTAPTTLEWRLKCLTTNQVLSDWTTVTSPQAQQSVTVAASLNAIQDDSNPYEDKEIAFRVNSGASGEEIQVDRYRVRNWSAVG